MLLTFHQMQGGPLTQTYHWYVDRFEELVEHAVGLGLRRRDSAKCSPCNLRPMRTFVLTTGRSGSVTFARACAHATNMTSGHETHAGHITGRLDYPNGHIETDNRLAWFLGPLHAAHPDAFYVHLTRDPTDTAASFARRSTDTLPLVRRAREGLAQVRGFHRASLIDAFQHGIIHTRHTLRPGDVEASTRLMVDTVNANITEFLRRQAASDRGHH